MMAVLRYRQSKNSERSTAVRNLGPEPERTALGQILEVLRKRARMSQRELSRNSGISYTQIGDLERGDALAPSPITLRALSRGLATDNFSEGGFDAVRADAFYRQLMDAAGYLGGLPVGAPPRAPDEDDLVNYLSTKTKDSDVSARLLRLAQQYPDMAPEDQLVIKRLVDIMTASE